ncbi:hypothetical protein O0S10_02215 [Methanocorpusculum sp. MG]|uniref:Uncharacterized protein n=1 Tax=Methanocorpusculum petauri TaxID=3002863 RepID=A0ABT4IFY9_9EURY|nr:hypothetical protein [Methanocorpusculum petauri]
MANEFERAVVICINRYFTEHRTKGFAYRLKQAHFNTQYIDIIVSGIQFTIIFERIFFIRGVSRHFSLCITQDKNKNPH